MAMRRVGTAEALAHKFPEWLLFVVTHDPDGPDDLMAGGWCMQCAIRPPMFAVALRPGRHSVTLIRQTGEFNLCWAGPGQHELLTWAGSRTGRDVDKFATAGVQTWPAAVNRAPLIEGCAMALECHARHEYPAGDHLIVVGEIVAAHLADPARPIIVNFGGRYLPARGIEGEV